MIPNDNLEEQVAQVKTIIVLLSPQLPKSEDEESISEEFIKNVQDVLTRNRNEIIAIAAAAGGFTVLIPTITVSIVTAVSGFTTAGVGAGMGIAIQRPHVLLTRNERRSSLEQSHWSQGYNHPFTAASR